MPTLNTHTSKDPSSKYATTEYNRWLRVDSHLRDIYASVIAYHSTFESFLARKTALHESGDYKRLTSYYRGMIAGCDRVLWGNLYGCIGPNKPLLMHVNIGPDGRVFPEGNSDWLAENTAYKSSMECKHIWRAPFESKGEFRYW